MWRVDPVMKMLVIPMLILKLNVVRRGGGVIHSDDFFYLTYTKKFANSMLFSAHMFKCLEWLWQSCDISNLNI